jgi:hypothetical protein
MASFVSPRTQESIDGHTVLVPPGETVVWLTGDGADDLTGVPDVFLMQSDLGLLGPTVVAGARRDGHQEWIVTGRNMQSIRLRAISAGTLPSQSLTFASCTIMFRAAAMGEDNGRTSLRRANVVPAASSPDAANARDLCYQHADFRNHHRLLSPPFARRSRIARAQIDLPFAGFAFSTLQWHAQHRWRP